MTRLLTRNNFIGVISVPFCILFWAHTQNYELPHCFCATADYLLLGTLERDNGLDESSDTLVRQAASQNRDIDIQDIEDQLDDVFRQYGKVGETYGVNTPCRSWTFTAYDPVSEFFNDTLPQIARILNESRLAICSNMLLMFVLFFRKRMRSLVALGALLSIAMALIGLLL